MVRSIHLLEDHIQTYSSTRIMFLVYLLRSAHNIIAAGVRKVRSQFILECFVGSIDNNIIRYPSAFIFC